GNFGLRHDPVGQRPILAIQLDFHAVGVATNVGGIIPRAIVHERPRQKLRPRVVTKAVVVREIGAGELAHVERDAIHVSLAGDLIGSILDVLLLAAEATRLPDVQAGDVGSRVGDADARDLAIGKAGDAARIAEARATGDLGIKYQLGGAAAPLPEAHVQEHG